MNFRVSVHITLRIGSLVLHVTRFNPALPSFDRRADPVDQLKSDGNQIT